MELSEGKLEGKNLETDESKCEKLLLLMFALMLTEHQRALELFDCSCIVSVSNNP